MNKTIKYLSLTGLIFGIVTIISGGPVLFGSDPGYAVFSPLVIFNTTMGFVYIASSLAAWKNPILSKNIAGFIFLTNLAVLITITYLFFTGSNIAYQSLGAMTFRTIVWLIIHIGIERTIKK